ncbi:MAG: DNA polymerase III subunit gamma/tau [Clostridiales bacterium]|jgi:DNA polymerase-3 subunit gamma/tau|nr:DNA polymerase III subunit gamma/tau [Clostridiales bacterium]
MSASHTVLYRKLRPKNFSDVLGQEHIVKTLINQLKSNRLAHAYLFCGTRGCGKTSAAKLLSRAVNCENPREGEPCNACPVCLEILRDASLNVSEINAADYTGVDSVRGIIEESAYPPSSGNFRVYIIDEAHMLSASAFNALLKTLEEPPGYVIFILATTDPQKIPATIHSRCQRFDFKRISGAVMFDAVRGYAAAEGIKIEDEALRFIISASDGAMRDCLSILEQCASFYFGEEISLEKTLELLGASDISVFFALAEAVLKADMGECMSLIDGQACLGRDISGFARQALSHFRNLLAAKVQQNGNISVSASGETIALLREQAARLPMSLIIRGIEAFSELLGNLRYAASERVMLEAACVALCRPEAAGPARAGGAPQAGEEQAEQIGELKAQLEELRKAVRALSEERGKPAEKAAGPPEKKKAADKRKLRPPGSAELKKIAEGWAGFTGSFSDGSKELPIKELLGKSRAAPDGGRLLIIVEDGVETLVRARASAYSAVILPLMAEKFGVSPETEIEYVGASEYKTRFDEPAKPRERTAEEIARNAEGLLGIKVELKD